MAEASDATLRAWLAYHGESRTKASPEQKNLFRAWQEITNLVVSEPESGWNAVLSLIELAVNDWQLASIAAGPLEDLLVHHPELFIDRVDEAARRNPRFRRCLSGVWLSENSPVRPLIQKYAATISDPL
jgi:hypothetical protein